MGELEATVGSHTALTAHRPSASPPSRELPSRDQIREWYERRCTLRSGAPGVTDPGATGAAAGAADPGIGAAAGTEDPGVGATAGAEDPGAAHRPSASPPSRELPSRDQIREWYERRCTLRSGAPGVTDPGATGAAAGAADPGIGAAAGTEDPGVGATAGAEDPGAARPPALPAMASLRVLTFDHEGRPIQLDTWLDDLQLYLLSDSRDSFSLFDHTSRASLSPPTTADSATRSQWLTRDAAARLAIRNHLPLAECTHFGQHKTAKALDHFLALDPTDLTLELLEQHPLAAETSIVAVGAARGTPCTPFFEGCSPSPLAASYASAATVDVLGAEDVEAASASGKRRTSKGKGGKSGGGGHGGGSGGSSGGGGGSGGGGSGGSGGGSGGFGGGGGGSGGSGGSGSSGSGGTRSGALCEWLFQHGTSGGSDSCPYVIRTGDPTCPTCGKPHTQHRCFSRLDDAWRVEFGDEAELPRWAQLLRSGVALFDLDYDAILAAMNALSVSVEGDYNLCVPPGPSIEAGDLGASESALPGTAPAEALHTFTLDSGASRCLFRDSTTLTPLSAPVPVRLADPSEGPVLARSSTGLLYPAVPSGSLSGLHLPLFSTNLVSTAVLHDAMVATTTPRGQRVSICTCTRMLQHLATFTRQPGSSLYILATKPPLVAASAQVSASGPVAPPCSCRLLSHQTLLWHHRLGHPSLPRLRGMQSRLLVSSLPRSLPPLPPSPALPCLPCVEGRQRAAPHSSSFPRRLLPCRLSTWTKGEVPDVLIPWISAFRLQLRERFSQDIPVLRLHSKRGSEFSSNLLRDFCLLEVARTSMIHAAAPHFLWPFPGAARGAASGVTASGGVELARAEPEVAEPAGAECRGAEFEGAGSGGAEPGGAGGGAEPGVWRC
ncbi:unnamed protein product [Closterium sp. NIES-54]